MVKLVDIDVERDAVLVSGWINAPGGAQMLQLMGMIVPDDFTTTVENEWKTLTKIVNDPNELAWMIEADGKIVGLVEAHTEPFESLPEPNISIMIGDAAARGKGLGTAANKLLLGVLRKLDYDTIYARVLTHNVASLRMMQKLGFTKLDQSYTDGDGLTWQNFKYDYGEL